MKIDNGYKLWYSAGDHTRPTLSHVLVARIAEVPDLLTNVSAEHKENWLNYGEIALPKEGNNGVAIATNGFILSVVPVELDDIDVSGLVDKDVFRYVMGRKSSGFAYFDLSNPTVTWLDDMRKGQELTVVRANGRFFPRLDIGKDAKFPNFIPVLPDLSISTSMRHVTLDFNNWDRARKAIGTTYVSFFFFGATKPVLFAGNLASRGFQEVTGKTPIRLGLPFAIVMPMHSSYDGFNDEVNDEEE